MKKVDFSIEGLLKEPYVASECGGRSAGFSVVHFEHGGCGGGSYLRTREVFKTAEEEEAEEEEEEEKQNFSWLFCSRFKPPKLPRSKKRSNCKRYGRGPRIPFAAHQISVLESAFRKSHYLSPDNISRLAETLYLSETRVKIWFQNRRARYRREQEMMALNSVAAPNSGIVTSGSLDFIQSSAQTHTSSAKRFISVPKAVATSALQLQHQAHSLGSLPLELSQTSGGSSGRRLFVFGPGGSSTIGHLGGGDFVTAESASVSFRQARSLSSPEILMDFSSSSSSQASSGFVNVHNTK